MSLVEVGRVLSLEETDPLEVEDRVTEVSLFK